MSTAILIIGESGSGKSASMRELNPAETLLIQCVRKPLPFKSTHWQRWDKESCPTGNVFVTDDSKRICTLMQKTQRPIIIIDDFQYTMAAQYMRRTDERGYDKFTDIGRDAWNVLTLAGMLPDHVRVYVLTHSNADETGRVRMKSIGKMVDQYIVPEGLFSIVLRTIANDGTYQFATQTNGSDTCKSPIGLFSERFIDNDLSAVDKAITEYYEIQTTA